MLSNFLGIYVRIKIGQKLLICALIGRERLSKRGYYFVHDQTQTRLFLNDSESGLLCTDCSVPNTNVSARPKRQKEDGSSVVEVENEEKIELSPRAGDKGDASKVCTSELSAGGFRKKVLLCHERVFFHRHNCRKPSRY